MDKETDKLLKLNRWAWDLIRSKELTIRKLRAENKELKEQKEKRIAIGKAFWLWVYLVLLIIFAIYFKLQLN